LKDIALIFYQGGVLMNRDQFIKGGLLTTKIFLNASGFLRITHQGSSSKNSRNHPSQHEDAPDPLDDTRIHPEDYELARKMAMDALELDEEDIHNEHPSHVVTLLMQDNQKVAKLDELNLDEFAISLYEANSDQKRFMLNVIRDELISPFAETREPFELPSDQQILTMLTGETTRTFGVHLIVSALVYRIQRDCVYVRLDSGIEGSIPVGLLSEQARNAFDVVKKGQAITAIVTKVELMLAQNDSYTIELSAIPGHRRDGDDEFRRGAQPDEQYWDKERLRRDNDMLQRKKRAETERSRRVIKHPNFHNFSSSQAETYLEKQQRGDVVIRPSSKGTNHLAVTWKVDDKLYQHIGKVFSWMVVL
jgi:transcription elongation factor SPT6